MNLKVLGCSGGIGPDLKTTSFLIDDVLLLDAGSGLETLSLEEMLKIRYVLITHAHLDHILGLPLLLATIYDQHIEPIQIFASASVLAALKEHIFNWVIWPDFTQLPSQNPIATLYEASVDEAVAVGSYEVIPLPAEHPSPNQGYYVKSVTGDGSLAFTGDSSFHLPFWERVNLYHPDLVIVDVSYTDDADQLSADSGHMTFSQLEHALSYLSYRPELRVTHFKVGLQFLLTRHCTSIELFSVKPLVHGECLRITEDVVFQSSFDKDGSTTD